MAAQQPESRKPVRSTTRRTLVTTELLDQATQLFAQKGYDATSLQDIADAMGVSRPALYHYVRSKEALLEMLVEQVSQGLADVLAELAGREDLTPTQKLRELTGLLVRQRAQHPAQFRILDQSENVLPETASTRHVEAKRRVLREMTSIVEAGIASGEFLPVPPRTAALSVLGMCNWVAWWIKPDAAVDPIVTTLTEFAERMLVHPGGRPTTPADVVRDIRTNLDWLEQHL
jgi:AcrR family transcriptional regulator